MPRYLVLIYGDEQVWDEAPQDWQDGNVAAHGVFNVTNASAVVTGGELARTASAVRIRADAEGHPRPAGLTDAPSPAGLGGFYLLDAADVDDAVRIASQLPEASAPTSFVEVRAVPGSD